jgi:hypothetical protein
MPLPASLKLFIEPTLGLAYSSFTGSTQVSNPSLHLGDKAQIEIYLVKDTGVPSYPREEVTYPVGLSLRAAIGPIDESPTGGTWRLSYGGDTTAAVPYNATTAQLQSALNALASITSAGGVTVTKVGDNYNILFNVVGARTELTTDATSLTPLSTAGVATLQVGDGSKPQIYLVHLQRTVAALATSFAQVTASTITVSAITAWDGIRATYRVAISPDPKGGTFSLNFDALSGTDVSTSAISVGASALDVQNALNVTGSALAGKVSVQQLGAYTYDVTVLAQPGTNGLTANASGLLSFNGYTGQMDLNTSSALALLDGAESVSTYLEVEITSDSKPVTVLQIPMTLRNAVTDEGSVAPLVLESYLTQTTADGRYFRISNNLSESTAATVRTNLDVYSTGQVDTALALKANLSGATFTGKIVGTVTATTAPLNLGTQASNPSTTANGDIWIGTNSIFYKDSTGTIRSAASPSTQNTFNNPQIISVNSATLAGLRITQIGSAEALRVEDSTNPDTSAFIVDAAGRVGINTSPNASACLTIDGTTNGTVLLTNGAFIKFGTSGGEISNVGASGSPFVPSGPFTATDYPVEISVTINGTTYWVPART